MKILVTGGGGFLGSALVRELLKRGHTVSILGRKAQPQLEQEGVTVHRGDIADYEAVLRAAEGAEAIFHTAAKADSIGSYESYYRPNVLGTRNVLKACIEQNIHYLIYTSTPSVAFRPGHTRGLDETAPYAKKWLCHYAKTKTIAEQEVLQAHCSGRLHTVALRPHLIWGPGEPHMIPRVIEQARKRKLKIIGNGENWIDITHVDNAVHAHLLAFEALQQGKTGGKAYFIGQEKPVQLWKWLNQILTGINVKPVARKIPLQLAYPISAVLEKVYKLLGITDPTMTRFVMTILATDHYFNLDAAKKDLGYAPLVNTEDGTAELIESLKG
tara:strand:- start:88677 stop:89660 length:984 start_codon:yes stop_codon:yes gene_type:complete